MSVINGLIVALTTPFTSNGIDAKSLQQHILKLNPYVNGLAIGGTTGESLHVTDDELVTALQAASAVAGDQLLIVGFWRPTIQTAIATAKYVQSFADVLLIPIPIELFKQDDDQILEFYNKVAKTTLKPILIYNFPEHCEQRAISAELAATIAKNNLNIIGVKDSSADALLAKSIIINNLPLQPILGNDRFLVEILQLMQDHKTAYQMASISGASSVLQVAKAEAEIYKLFAAGNYAAAQILQQELTNQFNTWKKQAAQAGGRAAVIKSLVAKDVDGYPNLVRPPLKEVKK